MNSKSPAFVMGRLATPIGEILVVTDGQAAVTALDFVDFEARLLNRFQRRSRALRSEPIKYGPIPEAVRQALEAYFAGEIRALEAVRVNTDGTEFQGLVWKALRRTPAGTTLSYSQLASAIDRPTAVRAVGLANGANPVAIIVPCHRIIGADGTLTGYAGGLDRKRWLLNHERTHRPATDHV